MLMLTPAELRHNSRVFRHSAMSEDNPRLKLRLASHALALAQLAEAIEREEAARTEGYRSVATRVSSTKEPPGASPKHASRIPN
jgi:hypothetical protein